MQCHVLGVDAAAGHRRAARRRRPSPRRPAPSAARSCGPGLAGLAIIALAYVPLVVHELTTDFAEVRAALVYLQAGGEPGRTSRS